MDATTTNILLSGGSPIALLLVGFWLKRLADGRTARILQSNADALTVANATKIVAEETARLASANLDKANIIETKVDGRLSKAVDDLAEANRSITSLTVAFEDFRSKADRFLQTGTGGAALEHAISLPAPSTATKDVPKP